MVFSQGRSAPFSPSGDSLAVPSGIAVPSPSFSVVPQGDGLARSAGIPGSVVQPDPYSIRLSRSRVTDWEPHYDYCAVSIPPPAACPREAVEVGFSFDWLTISQAFPLAGLPDFGSLTVFEVDPSGEVTRQFLKSASVEGSFSSVMRVRCFGGVVEVSGNPSRWNQRTSLEGLPSLSAAVEVMSSVVRQVIPSFPGFFFGPVFSYEAHSEPSFPGLRLSRVDVCRTYSVGSAAEAAFFVQAAGGCLWRQRQRPRVYPTSVSWGLGSPHAVRLYCKGPELRAHCGRGASKFDVDDVASWCDSLGVVRHEVQLRRKALVSFGLTSPHSWDGAAMARVLSESAPFSRLSVPASPFGDARAALVAAGFTPRRVSALMSVLYEYRDGRDPAAGRSVSAAFRDRRDILAVLGIDLRVPSKVAVLPVRVRELTLRPLVIPPRFRRVG